MLEDSANWLLFCQNSQLTKTVIHFFPSSGGTGAPYQAQCSLTLLRTDSEPKTIAIEGAKVSQPNGVAVEDVFPEICDIPNCLLPIFVEISSGQIRQDLSKSECIVELQSEGRSVMFRPKRITDDGELKYPLITLSKGEVGLISCSALATPVNCSLSDKVDVAGKTSFTLAAYGIREQSLAGLSQGLYLSTEQNGTAHYIVYRNNGRITAVVCV